MDQEMYDEAFRRISTRLADDTSFMVAVRLDLAIAGEPHDHLAQHPGELCACGHPIHDHAINDQTVGYCLACNCPTFTDEMASWPPI